jgi:hypothetical protein
MYFMIPPKTWEETKTWGENTPHFANGMHCNARPLIQINGSNLRGPSPGLPIPHLQGGNWNIIPP